MARERFLKPISGGRFSSKLNETGHRCGQSREEIAADFFGAERTNAKQTGREEKGIKRNGGEIVVK